MYIKSIKVQGLHKAIDAELEFSPDLGIIVGINGSGKTSIINLSAHLLRLNIPELSRIDYEEIRIVGKDTSDKTIDISATKVNGYLSLIARKSGRKIDEFKWLTPPTSLNAETPDEMAMWDRHMRRGAAEISTTPLAKFMRENAKLTLVKLDRTLFVEDYTGGVSIDSPISARAFRRPVDESDPIQHVEKATRAKFIEYQSQVKRLNEELTNKLVLQLFQVSDVLSPKNAGVPKIPESRQISKLENSIKKSSFYPKNEADQQALSEYFKITKALATEFSRIGRRRLETDIWQERFFFSAVERFDRLNMLAMEFNNFDIRANEAYKDLGAYLSALNEFLAESSKVAFFSELDNSLRFRLINDEEDTKGRPISELSSGEKQIVTVLAYLAYMAGQNSIFIIDEPELSLHISWQMLLLPALQALQPSGCQIIMATHSPEIVGNERNKVVKLIPNYRSRNQTQTRNITL